MLDLPRGLDWWREEPGGSDWLEDLPRLVRECAERWSLTLERAFEGSHVSLVVAVRLADRRPAALKLNFPEEESEREADALEHYQGEGAVLLLDHDPGRRALLIERCEPGSALWEVADEEEANRIAVSVLRRLWRAAPEIHPFRLLADEAERWAEELPRHWESLGRPFEHALLERALSALRDLGPDQEDQVVLHQDFHGGNVLQAEREPWLAVDPKPLVGERAFDAASLVRDRRDELAADPRPGLRIRRRLDQLSLELGQDRERLRGWGIVHALAWGISGAKLDPDMVGCARWLAEA